MDLELTGTPTDAIAALSLDTSKTYSVTVECNAGMAEVARFDDGGTSPATSGVRGAPFPHLETRRIKGDNLWLWVPGSTGFATIYEAVG